LVQKLNKITDILIYIFLGLAVFTSQFSIATSSIGIGGLIILTILKLLISKKAGNIEAFNVDKNIIYLFAAFIIIQVISSAVCGNPNESFDHIYRKISLYIIFFVTCLFIGNIKDLKLILIIFISFTALISVVEITRFSIDYLPNPLKPLSEYRLEYYGYPVTNGEIKMNILLLIIPFLLVKGRVLMNKAVLFVLSLPLFITFYLTNARNAILGLFTGLVIYGALKFRYFLLVLSASTVIFLLFAPAPLKERIYSIADLEHPSNKSRFIMWETGTKIIKDNLLFGTGDVDINKIYRMYKTPEFHGEGSHMHSNTVQILVNFGIFGFLAWAALMLYLILKQIKIYLATCNNNFLNILAMISIASFAAMQVSGLTEWNFGDAEYAAVFWFNLALAFTSFRLLQQGEIK